MTTEAEIKSKFAAIGQAVASGLNDDKAAPGTKGAILGLLMLFEQFVLDLHRTADALEAIAGNTAPVPPQHHDGLYFDDGVPVPKVNDGSRPYPMPGETPHADDEQFQKARAANPELFKSRITTFD